MSTQFQKIALDTAEKEPPNFFELSKLWYRLTSVTTKTQAASKSGRRSARKRSMNKESSKRQWLLKGGSRWFECSSRLLGLESRSEESKKKRRCRSRLVDVAVHLTPGGRWKVARSSDCGGDLSENGNVKGGEPVVVGNQTRFFV